MYVLDPAAITHAMKVKRRYDADSDTHYMFLDRTEKDAACLHHSITKVPSPFNEATSGPNTGSFPIHVQSNASAISYIVNFCSR
jgi:hypothetical protein